MYSTLNYSINIFFARFHRKYGMPGVFGIVDGTHICIRKPDAHIEHVYYAVRKASHTKNVQIVSIFILCYI